MMRAILSKKILMNSYKEITIPVPWGKISGKWWGPSNCKPILCIHGFRDNCGSFDKLIPLLSENKNISFLTIDLPGHGYSSPFPQGMIYNFMNYVILVQLIYEYFEWSKLTLLGHSLGSMIAFISTLLYPEKVDSVICIDALQPLQSVVSKESVRKSVDDFLKYNKFGGEPPAYSLEEIIQKMNHAYHQSLDIESILCLLERNITQSKVFPGKYCFTVDPILKVRTMLNWNQDQMIIDAATIRNPIFICEAKQSYLQKYRKLFHEILDVLRTSSKECDFHMIIGSHHLHLSEPEKIGVLIRNFLDKHHNVESSNLKDLTIFSDPVPSSFKDIAIKHKL